MNNSVSDRTIRRLRQVISKRGRDWQTAVSTGHATVSHLNRLCSRIDFALRAAAALELC